jgi:hypothetical protein
MSKKWYNYFVSMDEDPSAGEQASSNPAEVPASPGKAAQSVAEIAGVASVEPNFAASAANLTSFEEIYRAAEIPAPPQGYSILKVADMLQSEHIRSLPMEVKRSSVLVALDAAGVDIKDVIQDAVRRDRALDVYESVQQRAVEELEARKIKENAQIQADIDRFVAEQQAKIQKNNQEVSQEKERFFGWRLKKQQEEKKISDAVAYFTTENPITAGSPGAPATTAPKTAQRS